MWFLRVVERLDGGIDRVFHLVTRKWSQITGRSNFALARLSMLMGLVLITSGHMLEFYLDRDVGSAFFLFLLTPVWLWLGTLRLRFFREIERDVESVSDVLRLNPVEMSRFAMDRIFFTVWLLLLMPGVLAGRPVNSGFFLYIASHYFVMHFDCKGGKSLARRAVEALKKAGSKVAEKARDLVPQPQPIPVPIGA
jgi:hypothetical protein